MIDDIQLNVPLLKRRVPNLTKEAQAAGLRAATVSNLTTGKTPVGKAEVRTLVTLANLAGCRLDDLIIRGGGVGMIETGIKIIDLFAPIVRGGTIGFVARPGMGQLVLLSELFHRMKERDFATVFWMPKEEAYGISDVTAEAEIIGSNLDDIYNIVESIRNERDVILGADRSVVLSGELFQLKEKLQEAGARPITIALVDTRGDGVTEDVPYGPLDALLRFDMDLATRKMYPAVSPVYSTSTFLEGAQMEAAHMTIQQRAKKLLRRYQELRSLVNAWGKEKLPDTDLILYNIGEKLEAFLTQPFFVAEEFTKKSGEYVSLNDTLDGVRRIMDGATDEIDVSDLLYIGKLKN